MELTEEEFDKLMRHTLRIELLSGMVLIYRVSTDEKKRLISQLRNRSGGGDASEPWMFLYFQTSLQRNVAIRVSEIVRVIFCFDAIEEVVDPNAYYDNFRVLEKDTNIVEEATPEGKVELIVVTEEFLPSAIIFHKGDAADDGYDSNPLVYYDLEPGCLDVFNLELDDPLVPMRQFINLMDMDGEANFIALAHILVMEFEEALLHDFEYDDDNNDSLNEPANNIHSNPHLPDENKSADDKEESLPF